MAVAPSYVSNLEGGATNHVVGDLREAFFTGTVGAADTYLTGGFAITPAQFGLSKIINVEPPVFSTGHTAIYVPATGKIKVFSAAGTELVNASAALQNATFVIQVQGK